MDSKPAPDTYFDCQDVSHEEYLVIEAKKLLDESYDAFEKTFQKLQERKRDLDHAFLHVTAPTPMRSRSNGGNKEDARGVRVKSDENSDCSSGVDRLSLRNLSRSLGEAISRLEGKQDELAAKNNAFRTAARELDRHEQQLSCKRERPEDQTFENKRRRSDEGVTEPGSGACNVEEDEVVVDLPQAIPSSLQASAKHPIATRNRKTRKLIPSKSKPMICLDPINNSNAIDLTLDTTEEGGAQNRKSTSVTPPMTSSRPHLVVSGPYDSVSSSLSHSPEPAATSSTPSITRSQTIMKPSLSLRERQSFGELKNDPTCVDSEDENVPAKLVSSISATRKPTEIFSLRTPPSEAKPAPVTISSSCVADDRASESVEILSRELKPPPTASRVELLDILAAEASFRRHEEEDDADDRAAAAAAAVLVRSLPNDQDSVDLDPMERCRPPQGPSVAELNACKTNREKKALHSWYTRLNELYAYYEEHGDMNVPQKYDKNEKLGIWVNKQRIQFKLSKSGRKSSMTPQKIRHLEAAGFFWGKTKGVAAWEEKFQELKEYKKKHGHCNAPTKHHSNGALGRWVSTQRSMYKDYQDGREATNGASAEEIKRRITLLNEIGFRWSMIPSKQMSSSLALDLTENGTSEPCPEKAASSPRCQDKKVPLQLSRGRSREQMNILLSKDPDFFLEHGVFAKFGQSTFCTQNNKLSHIVLNKDWNQLASSQGQPQEFYVGTGVGRKRGAQVLEKTTTPIALFFDHKRSGNRISYVGHWKPIASTAKWFDPPVSVLDNDRQFFIELHFDHYDEELDEVIRKG